MIALAEIINRLLAMLEKWVKAQEQERHESTVKEIQSNPGAFMSDHFGGVPDKLRTPSVLLSISLSWSAGTNLSGA